MFLKLLAINQYAMDWILFHPLTIPDFINFTVNWSKTHGLIFLRVPYGIFAGKLLSKSGKGFFLFFFPVYSLIHSQILIFLSFSTFDR